MYIQIKNFFKEIFLSNCSTYVRQYVNLTGGLMLSLFLKLHLDDELSHVHSLSLLCLVFPYGLI